MSHGKPAPTLQLVRLEDRLTPAAASSALVAGQIPVVVASSGTTGLATGFNGLTGVGLGNPSLLGAGTGGVAGSTGLANANLATGTAGGFSSTIGTAASGTSAGSNIGNTTGTALGGGFGNLSGTTFGTVPGTNGSSGFTSANLGSVGGISAAVLSGGTLSGTNGAFTGTGSNGLTATNTLNGLGAGNLTTGGTASNLNNTLAGNVAASQPAAVGRVTVFGADGAVRFTLDPFPGFTGGLRTATADVNGDGTADIVVGAGQGGGPRVAVFDGRTGQTLADFFAYPDDLRDGVYVGAGDLNGDGRAEVATGAGDGGGPRVRTFDVFNGVAAVTNDFFAFDPGFRGGVTVAIGDVAGDGVPVIVAGAGSGGGPLLATFSRLGTPLGATFVGDPNARDGALVGGVTRAADGSPAVAVGGANVRLFDAATGLVRGVAAGAAPTEVTVYNSTGTRPLLRVARGNGVADQLLNLDGTPATLGATASTGATFTTGIGMGT